MRLSTTLFHVCQSLFVASLKRMDFRNSVVGYLHTQVMQHTRCGQDEVQPITTYQYAFGGSEGYDIAL